MEVHLKIIGALFILLALLHLVFPRYFDWKNDLKPLKLINRQMMIVHTFFIAFVVLLMGLLCLTASEDLLMTPLGKKLLFGMGIFWFARLIIQFTGYSSQLWRGKAFERNIHILFSLLWTYISGFFFYSYLT